MTNLVPTTAHHTIGAAADSGYEYFLKQWLLMGDARARDQCERLLSSCPTHRLGTHQTTDLTSIEGIINNLLHITPNRELLYVTSESLSRPTNTFEHLACFLPGLLALGAYTLPFSHLPPKKAELHKWAAEGLAYTCYLTYADQRSGLGPDGVQMSDAGKWVDFVRVWESGGRRGAVPPGLREGGPVKKARKDERDYMVTSQSYLLRPEVRNHYNFLSVWLAYITLDRRWKAFISCIKLLEM